MVWSQEEQSDRKTAKLELSKTCYKRHYEMYSSLFHNNVVCNQGLINHMHIIMESKYIGQCVSGFIVYVRTTQDMSCCLFKIFLGAKQYLLILVHPSALVVSALNCTKPPAHLSILLLDVT